MGKFSRNDFDAKHEVFGVRHAFGPSFASNSSRNGTGVPSPPWALFSLSVKKRHWGGGGKGGEETWEVSSC